TRFSTSQGKWRDSSALTRDVRARFQDLDWIWQLLGLRFQLCGNEVAGGFGIFGGINVAVWKLVGQLQKELLCQLILLFAARGKRQKDLSERREVPAAIDGFFQLLHAKFFVAVNTSEPQHETCAAGEAADDVVCRAERNVSVIGLWFLNQQNLCKFVRLF